RRSEVRLDELRSVGGGVEVIAVSGVLVEREEGLTHGKRVAEIRACGIGVVMTEAAAGEVAVDDDPLRGTLCFGECGLVAAGRVEIAERGDHPSVLARVNMLVDARNALCAASGVVELEVGFVVLTVVDVRILRDEEDSGGSIGEERMHEAMH